MHDYTTGDICRVYFYAKNEVSYEFASYQIDPCRKLFVKGSQTAQHNLGSLDLSTLLLSARAKDVL